MIEFGEKSLAAEKLHHRHLSAGNAHARIQRRAAMRVGDGEADGTRVTQSLKIKMLVGTGSNLHTHGLALRVIARRGIQLELPDGQCGLILAALTEYPSVWLAAFRNDDDGLFDAHAAGAAYAPAYRPRHAATLLDILSDDRLQVAAGAHLQPRTEHARFARLQPMPKIQIHRSVADDVGVRRMRRHAEIFVVRDDPPRERGIH